MQNRKEMRLLVASGGPALITHSAFERGQRRLVGVNYRGGSWRLSVSRRMIGPLRHSADPGVLYPMGGRAKSRPNAVRQEHSKFSELFCRDNCVHV